MAGGCIVERVDENLTYDYLVDFRRLFCVWLVAPGCNQVHFVLGNFFLPYII